MDEKNAPCKEFDKESSPKEPLMAERFRNIYFFYHLKGHRRPLVWVDCAAGNDRAAASPTSLRQMAHTEVSGVLSIYVALLTPDCSRRHSAAQGGSQRPLPSSVIRTL